MKSILFPGLVASVLATGLIPLPASAGTDVGQSARRIDGYRGIWFTLGQYYGVGEEGKPYGPRSREPVFPYGDKYSGGLGTYTAKHTPLAIYCREVRKTFFVYGGTTEATERHLLCMVSYYDHVTNRVPPPVVVHDKEGVDDPHDNPSLAIDGQGHVWVFVSGRARHRPGFKYRSAEPYSIDRFECVARGEMTYPQPKFLSQHGWLNLFTQYTGVRELYFERSRDGRIWGPVEKLAGIREPGQTRGGHYQTSAVWQGKVGTVFNRHPHGDPDRRTDLYYAETADGGATWTSVTGEVLGLPLTTVVNPARVIDYAAQGLNVYLKDIGFDAGGRPVVLYLTSPGHEPGPPNDPRLWRLTRWTGSVWRTSVVGRADHNYDMGSLDLTSEVWRVIGPARAGPQPYHAGGEIGIWSSYDLGASWTLTGEVTGVSRFNHNYVRRPLQAEDPFFFFWADGDPTALSASRLYFTDSSGGRVWRLPYTMEGEWAEPERVR